MSFSLRLFRLACLVSLLAIALILSAFPVQAQFYDLEVAVGDTVGYSGQQNSVISVYMANWADTVAGFNLWLMLEHPGICEFVTNTVTIYDTTYWDCFAYEGDTCTDSADVTDTVLVDPAYPWEFMNVNVYDAVVGNHDVTGTLIENWEFVESRSIATPYNLRLAALANESPPPYTRGIGYPQTGQIPLIKILADIYDIPDTATERDVKIYIQYENLDYFGFSDEHGDAIGVITDTILDSNCWECLNWDGEVCIWFELTSCAGAFDSVSCCDTILSGHLDTSVVKIRHGTLTVLAGLCGDINGNSAINLLDVTYLIAYLYKGGPPPPSEWASDVNSSGGINLLDVTYLIAYLYKGGPVPNCP